MVLKCYLCKCPPDKSRKISLHSFPKCQTYPVIYNQWLAACGLTEKDDVSRKRICSCHFREQDKLLDYSLTKIKPEAIPSINVKTEKRALQKQIENKNDEDFTPHPHNEKSSALVSSVEKSSQISEKVIVENLTKIKPEAIPLIIIKTEKPDLQKQIENKNDEDFTPHSHNEKSSDLISCVEKLLQISEKVIVEDLNNMDDLDNHFELLYSSVMEKKTCTVMTFPMKAGLAPMENISGTTHYVSETSTTNDSGTLKRTLDTTVEAEKACSTFQTPQKKRRYFHPRYVSEIQTQDVATPRSASRIIRFVKEEDERKTAKIKNLQAANRRLQKRVTLLESLLSEISNDL